MTENKMNDKNTVQAEKIQKLDEKMMLAAGLGASLAEMKGLSKDTLEGIYAYAYDFYNKGRLDDAEIFFKFLCIYDFQNPDYVKGYAAVSQLKKEYQRAYDLYWVSFNFDKTNDYTVVLFMGQCQISLKNLESAKECFQVILDCSNDDALKVKAKAYLDIIEQKDPFEQEVAE